MLRALPARCRRSSARLRPARGRYRPRRSPRSWQQLGAAAEIVPEPRAALPRAREIAGPDGAVIATGSIYLIADLVSAPGASRASAL